MIDDYKNMKKNFLVLKNKNIVKGGSPDLVIHISGASGSGKTTLGKKLEKKYGSKIVVKDIDDLRSEFIKEHYGDKEWQVIDKDAYQKFIDDYVEKINKPLIFVGLNNMFWWHKDLYYNMHSTYNFYINLDNETILKHKCIRHLTDVLNDITNNEKAINYMIDENKNFIKSLTEGIKRECNASKIIENNEKWKKDYKKQKYKITSREEIYDSVCKILDKKIKKKNNNYLDEIHYN
jgi:ABC-type oligopeptide transport system ATPase subunit